MSIITLTITGTVAPVTGFGRAFGIDYGGYFGPAGASLAGQDFTVTWTGIDCNCFGRDVSFNPIIDAVLTINGHSYDFGSGSQNFNDFAANVQQVENPTAATQLTTWYAGFGSGFGQTPGHDGSFSIQPCCNADVETQAFLTISVPAPVMGTELPGLLAMLIIFGGFYWKRHQLRSTPSM